MMNTKLSNIVSIISNNRYNDYQHFQKNTPIILERYLAKRKFSKAFIDLLNLSKNIIKTPIKTVIKDPETILKIPIKTVIKHPKKQKNIISPKKINIKKKFNFTENTLFNKIIKEEDLYIIKVKKSRYDFYSEIFMKAIDKLFCVLPDEESISYLKDIKYKILETFNKKNLYKMHNYSTKNFKKSDLDDVFANNKPIKFSMLKVFADVFHCNLVYLEKDTINFITRFVDNLAIIVLNEDERYIYCLRTKNKNTYIRAESIKKYFNVNQILNAVELEKQSLEKLQNFSRMKNIDYKKKGKTKKINKTKKELIDELIKI